MAGRWVKLGFALALLVATLTTITARSAPESADGYPLVSIADSTQYVVTGKVEYKSRDFCTSDSYSVKPGTVWMSNDRGGICLATKITATVKTPQGDIEATPYESSGTSYSQFAVINTGGNNYAVTHQVS